MRNAKIVCTLGPASDDRETIRGLADAGMSVARLNASHGTTEDRAAVIDRIRAVDRATDDPLAAMVDLQGPEVRTADIESAVELATGSTVRFVVDDDADEETVGLSHSIAAADPGDVVLLDDGLIECTVERVDGDAVVARVDSGGRLKPRKGVNVPGVDLGIDLVTESDEADIRLAAETEADFLAASFVSSADDVYTIRDRLENHGGDDVAVISKVERAAAVDRLPEIIDASYGVMVARGDLGVECPLEEVPMIQKRIVTDCKRAGVPVITATEMLDSMIEAPRPTRAEASDVANAVLDGTDAVMLSGETAVGDHPVRVVETMARIVREVETSEEYDETQKHGVPQAAETARTEALARSARYLARDVDAAAVVAASESGYTARRTAKFRPAVPVIATTPDDRVRRKLALSWGVQAEYAEYGDTIEAVLDGAVTAAQDAGVAESGDTIVVLSGMMTGIEGTDATNTLKVHVVAEDVAAGRSVVSGKRVGPLARADDGDLDAVPEGAIVALTDAFVGEFGGDLDRVAGIVDAREGTTGYPAIVARELEIPMISGAAVDDEVADGETITLDADRGVVYAGDVAHRDGREG